jgi:proline dehydrogenase
MKIDFSNTEVAFILKSSTQLQKAKLLFDVMAHPTMVSFLKGGVKLSFALGLPIKGIIKKTVFEHFCGGEKIEECTSRIAALHTQHVSAILDYSVEGKESTEDFERTKNMTIATIQTAKSNPAIPLAVFKPSGMGSHAIYEKVSSGATLTDAEKAEWAAVRARYYEIAEAAVAADIPVMVDAEETWLQQAIDDLVEELMAKYNHNKALVFNTAQLYRWDRLDYIKKAVGRAREKGYHFGIKIVRGAYMEKERERAKEKGYRDPIQPDKASTDRDYDAAVTFLIDNIDMCAVVVGTHNEASSQMVADSIDKKGIAKNDTRVYGSQLYGMSDNLSFNMAHAGYNVVKYLPFGPVKDVMPYLFRRAEENTSVKGQTGRELSLISKELERRKKAKKSKS